MSGGDIRKHLFGEGIAFYTCGSVAAVGDDGRCLDWAKGRFRNVVGKARVTIFNQPVFSAFQVATICAQIFGELA